MNTKSNLIQMAIADGCKTIRDLAVYINKIKSKNESKSINTYFNKESLNSRVIVRF